LRITVTPTDPHKTYYAAPTNTQPEPNVQQQPQPQSQAQAQPQPQPQPALQPSQTLNVFSRHTELGEEELKNEAIYEFMKLRYREYDPANRPADFVLRDRGNYLPCLIRHIDRCRPAEKGTPFYGDMSYYEDISKKKENESRQVNPLLGGN
jgi:hypothetical protein